MTDQKTRDKDIKDRDQGKHYQKRLNQKKCKSDKGDRDDGIEFSNYVNELRSKNNLPMITICEGLCTIQEVFYLEKGERPVGRLLQEAILERLGTGAEDYEYYLDYEDYKRWKARHYILHAIIHEKFQEAENLLEEYKLNYCGFLERMKMSRKQKKADEVFSMNTEEKLEYQFYLSILAQLGKCFGRPKEELYDLFEKALSLTVEEYEKRPVSERVLSFKELNLMLEMEKYRKEGERYEKYLEILKYIEKKSMDRKGKVKIYPKAVYYFCHNLMNNHKISEAGPEQLLFIYKHCNLAFNILCENERMYFLWEILCFREKLLYHLLENYKENRISQTFASVSEIEFMIQKNIEWKNVLEKIYEEEQVPKETFEYCYLYVSNGACCVNDVIRIRRKMLGMSQKKLSEGICDVRTVRRLEQYENAPQRAIREALFQRLGLSKENMKTDLVTGNPEAKELWEELRNHVKNRHWEKVEEIMTRIREVTSLEIKCNRQAFMRKEALMLKECGKISVEEYHSRLKEALELTLPYEAFLQEGEKYLTMGERACIQNRMIGMEKGSEELLTCMRRFEEIYFYYEKNDLLETVMGTYDYIMGYIGGKWGNEGEYDKADYYNCKIKKYSLRCRRSGCLSHSIYDRWWNNGKRIEEGIPVDKVLGVEELEKCILISELCKSSKKSFYQKQLKIHKTV